MSSQKWANFASLHLHLLTVSFDLATSIFKIPRFKSLILQHQVRCKRQHKNRKKSTKNFKPMTSTNRIIGSTTVAPQSHWSGNIFCYINFSSFNILPRWGKIWSKNIVYKSKSRFLTIAPEDQYVNRNKNHKRHNRSRGAK